MNAETFRSIHEASGLNSAQLARFLRIEDARSIRRYRSGETAVSGPVSFLMELLSEDVLTIGDGGRIWAARAAEPRGYFHSITEPKP